MKTKRTEKASSLTANAFWLMLAKTLGFVFSFALPLLLVRRLDQTEFGLYKQVFLIVGTAVSILPLGFGMSAFYFLPRERERQGAVVFNILLFNVLVGGLACLVLILRPTLLVTLFKAPEIVSLAPLVGLVIFTWIVSSFIEIVVIANQEARLATVFIILSQFTRTALMLAAAVFFGNVRALVVAAMIQGALQTLLLLFYMRSRFADFWRELDWSILRSQLAYALPLGFAGLLYITQTDFHNYFVTNRFGPAAYAIYAIGCFDLPLIGILAESVGAVMIPRVSYLQKQQDHREIINLTMRVMRKLAVIHFPLYALMLVVGREFITVLFTAKYISSWPIFIINLTLLPFYIVALDPIVRAFTRLGYFLLRLRILLFIILMAALWFGTARFGLIGAISVVIGVKLVEHLIMTYKAARTVGLARRDLLLLKDVGKLALATLTASAAAAFVRIFMFGAKPFLTLVVCGAIFAITYLIAVLLLKIMTADEREEIRRRVSLIQQRFFSRRVAAPLISEQR